MHISYKPKGVCSSRIDLELEDGVIKQCRFQDGCSGNTQGLSKLVEGQNAQEVVARLQGICCRNGTSCPDQLAQALKQALGNP